MDLAKVLDTVASVKKTVDSILKVLREIPRLEQNRIGNLARIRSRLTKLDEAIKQLEDNASLREALSEWAHQYEFEISDAEESLRKQFGAKLETELEEHGLSLSGHYPELKTGFFTLELDFDKGRATIWYGPKQERIGESVLSAGELARRIASTRQELGSRVREDEFMAKLHEAYCRAGGGDCKERVPIIKVLPELAYSLQDLTFYQDPRRENFKSYGRADFSYDLFRIGTRGADVPFDKRLHLTVATRSQTRKREDFLWVPDEEGGRGSYYALLHFKEL